MTLLIGANLKKYTIIAADTRASWCGGHKDGDHKIAMCDLGLITGSGYADALNAVKRELLDQQISHTDQILEIIRQKALPKLEIIRRDNPALKDNTRFLVSYRAVPESDPALRLRIVYTKQDCQLSEPVDQIIVMPQDSSQADADQCDDFFMNNLLKDEVANNSLIHNVKLIVECFRQVSQKSSLISRDVDVAALFIDGTVMYGYVNLDKFISSGFEMKVVPPQHKTCFLTPDILSESL